MCGEDGWPKETVAFRASAALGDSVNGEGLRSMKQILQNLRTGAVEVADVPVPAAGPGRLLIETRRTLVSAGTG